LSRISSLGQAGLEALFARETDKSIVMLLTVTAETISGTKTFYLCDQAAQRLTVEAGDFLYEDNQNVSEYRILYGVNYNNTNYYFVPVQITLPSENEAQAPTCSLVFSDVTQLLTPIIRETAGNPKVRVDLGLVDYSTDPATVSQIEASFGEFYMTNITYNMTQVSFDLAMTDFSREPFPQHSMTPYYFPGIF
jgi:hypothetical protein